MSPVNKHLPIPIPLAEWTQSHRSVTLYHCVYFRNVHINTQCFRCYVLSVGSDLWTERKLLAV